jgi:hypothetical protein
MFGPSFVPSRWYFKSRDVAELSHEIIETHSLPH